MSDTKKIIYFRPVRTDHGKPNPYGDGSGSSFENAKFISSLVTDGYGGKAGVWKNCDIRIAHYIVNGVRGEYQLTIPGVIQFENTLITGGYTGNNTLTPLVTSNIAAYATLIRSHKKYTDESNKTQYAFVHRQFQFLGNCVVKYLQFEYICTQNGDSGVIISGKNNQFILSRIDECVTGIADDDIFITADATTPDGKCVDKNNNMFSIDMSNSTDTIIQSCYFDHNINKTKLCSLKNYANIPPWQYCIGNNYNRGINDNNIVANENDPLKIENRWRSTIGDICNFEMFGCSPYCINNDGTLSIDTDNLGGYFTGIKYRNSIDQSFPIKQCDYTQIQSTRQFYVYFKRTGWGDISKNKNNTRTDNTLTTVEAEQNNQKYKFRTTDGTVSSLLTTTSSILLSTNGVVNQQSGLTYDNALPLCTIYELDIDKYNNDNSKIKANVFVGELKIDDNSTKYYTYNYAGEQSWYNTYNNFIKKVNDKPVVLYDGMYEYIKKHPNQILGNSKCCVDAFSYIGGFYNYCDIEPHTLTNNVYDFDLSPRQINIYGSVTGSYADNTPMYTYNNRTSDSITNTSYSYFAHQTTVIPSTSASIICYGLTQHRCSLQGFTGCNIKVYDKYINPNTPFKVGNVECTNDTYHMYSAVILGKQCVNANNGVGSSCKCVFIVDENSKQKLLRCSTITTNKPKEFWPSVVSTSCYGKYYIAPCYGGGLNTSPIGTLAGQNSRYYYESCKGVYIYNPINIECIVAMNNISCSEVNYGYVSSLTLSNVIIAPPSTTHILNAGIECSTNITTNTIADSLIIAGENASNSSTFTTFVTGLDRKSVV